MNTRALVPAIRVTREEADTLFTHRRDAIVDYLLRLGRPAWPVGVRPNDLRAELRVWDRDREGCLRASVFVSAGSLKDRYTRHLRLVPRKPYSVSSTLQLRQG